MGGNDLKASGGCVSLCHMSDAVGLPDSWKKAEVFAVSCLRAWGYSDARLTRGGADGGVDVEGAHVLAQVKHRSAPAGRPDIQRLYGARGRGSHDLYFFALGGYSQAAVDYAEVHDIGLFSYDTSGRVTARTRVADKTLPKAPVAEVSLAPGKATNGQTPDDAASALGWLVLPAIAGLVMTISVSSGRDDFGTGIGAGAITFFFLLFFTARSGSDK